MKATNAVQFIGDIAILTTNGKSKVQFIIDREDYDKVKVYNWYVGPGGYITAPAKFKSYSKKGNIIRQRIYLQRLVINNFKEDFVCFNNKDKYDCRKNNLLVVNVEHKHAHKRGYKTYNGKVTTSIYKGVTKYNFGDKNWIAQIGHKGKLICIGYFDTEEDAALAYNKKALEFWGEYAYLNNVTNV